MLKGFASTMELHRAAQPSVVGGAIEVELSPRPASCKPRDRWLKEQAAAGKPCGGENSCC
ncbi:MAG: hypothetical protein E5V74_16430 [Mesorhizobium sp.]|nr:MAG: hypothetical protein E5V74_16430 [Mesorhizobium sp.]